MKTMPGRINREIGYQHLAFILLLAFILSAVPQKFFSFAAVSKDSPTDHVFIKWEPFKYDQKKKFQAAR
jgi:hypothetical protein